MNSTLPRTSPLVLARLCLMMFIQYGVWSFWLTTMAKYLSAGLNFEGDKIGLAYSTTGWGAIAAPFLVGMIADRFCSAQIMLGILHLLTAALLWMLTGITDPTQFTLVLLGAMLCYMPTLALANSIGFEHVKNPRLDFPFIRMFSPLGWIIAGLVVGSLPSLVPSWFGGLTDIESTAIPFKLSALFSALMGFYAFTLPHTPPKSLGKKVTFADIAGLQTLSLMKDRSFAVFVVCSLLLCIPASFYFQSAAMFFTQKGMEQVASKMVLAQVSDVVFIAVMPFCLRRLGIKGIILAAVGAWVVRYVLFAMGASQPDVSSQSIGDSQILTQLSAVTSHLIHDVQQYWMFYGGILLHGICYDFFFLAGQIYVDQRAPNEVRANAQGFIALVTLGLGMTIGNILNGYVTNWVTTKTVDSAGQLTSSVIDWQTLWLVPTAISALVGLLFIVLFHEKPETAAASPIVADQDD
ncbi:MFS transporter [Planctomicrobium sp. SH527]|uniref:MFS transporter n=1 Tax=Planctomicrobium sp. SH527 TaxID=3448123 RepID=UPI003F5C9D59